VVNLYRVLAARWRSACEAARQHGRSEPEIDEVWTMIEGFRGFMFNKAHSAEYAVEAFQGAWLKRRWPAHYLAAVLSNYRGFYAHSPTLPQILYVMGPAPRTASSAVRIDAPTPAWKQAVWISNQRSAMLIRTADDMGASSPAVGRIAEEYAGLRPWTMHLDEPRGLSRGLPSLPAAQCRLAG
jgi:hypothetical protein